MSFLISVKSTEDKNGYNYSMDFPEALIIDPNSKISLVNLYYERQSGVLLDNNNSYMYVRIGSADAPLQLLTLGVADNADDTVGQTNPELQPNELANRIEDRFNAQFGGKGYTISVLYKPNDNTFEITNFFKQVSTQSTHPANFVFTNSELSNTDYGSTTGDINISTITDTTENWIVSGQPLQTMGVPTSALGGSSFSVDIETQSVAGPNDAYGLGVVLALALAGKSGELGTAGGTATTAVCNPANGILDNTLCSLAYFTRTNNEGYIQITEKDGVVLTATQIQTLTAGSQLMIKLNGDSASSSKASVRYFFRNGPTGKITEVKPTQRTLVKNDWVDADLTPCIGCDTDNFTGLNNILQTIGTDTSTMAKMDWLDLTNTFLQNGPSTYLQNDAHYLGVDYIVRKEYDADSVQDNDSGVVSPRLNAGQNSQLQFTVSPTFFDGGQNDQQLFINIGDEVQRLLNITNGQVLGTDSYVGLTTDGSGNDRGNVKNPNLLQFVLLGNGNLNVRADQNTDVANFITLTNVNNAEFNTNNLGVIIETQAESNVARIRWYNIKTPKTKHSSQWFNLPRMNASGTPNHIPQYNINNNQYYYHINIAKWTTGFNTTDYWLNPIVGNVQLDAQQDDATTGGFIELDIDADDNDSLGAVIGFKKGIYQFPSPNTAITGEGNYDPHYKDENPNRTVYLNCPTLNLRNVIGQKFSSTDTIAGGPQGNLQGVNRYLAKVPRYHEEAGGVNGTKSNTGPFYYDYFPYAIPLNNASEINTNDLQLTLTTDDNKFATDIVYSEVLISITNVESAGQGFNRLEIGMPKDLPQTYSQQNILQSHMTPSLS